MITEHGLPRRIAELRQEIRQRDPVLLANCTGAKWENGRFQLPFWGTAVSLSWPECVAYDRSGQELDMMSQAQLAYYFHTANGVPLAGRWIAFNELPDGQFYTTAFQGYTGQKLVQAFGEDVETFAELAVRLGGQPEVLGDAAYRFAVFPHVALLIVVWLGDEDFPTAYKLLFDAHSQYHLPTDACAILGSILTGKLIHLTTLNQV